MGMAMKHGNIELLNEDCMELLKHTPDKFYELAIVDPQYGIGVNHSMGRRKGDKHSGHKPAVWDNEEMPPEYFVELKRVSKNRIIWGANHFIENMPWNSPCWLMWDKGFSEELTFAQFELAWASFDTTAKKFETPTNNGTKKIHPTQKPVALYKWLLKNYAKPGDKILDTHAGSFSIGIACHDYGFALTATELDKDYYEAACKRFAGHVAQQKLFAPSI